jgi:hypothetical protein
MFHLLNLIQFVNAACINFIEQVTKKSPAQLSGGSPADFPGQPVNSALLQLY